MDSIDGGSENSPYTAALLKELAADQASLWTALSRTSTAVARATNGAQRPFVSSDMNGDVYLRLPSKTRRLKAVVIGVGRYKSLPLAELGNVYKDVDAWTNFLRSNGFDVSSMRDPTRAAVLETLEGLRIASAYGESGYFRRTGISVKDRRPETRSTAVPDTLVVVFYAGVGFQVDSDRYLTMADSRPESRDSERLHLESTIAVNWLEQTLRHRAAASIVIYDTQFNVLK